MCSENKIANIPKPDEKDNTQVQNASEVQEDSMMSDTLDIALPSDEPPSHKPPDVKEGKDVTNAVFDNKEANNCNEDQCTSVSEISDPIKDDSKQFSPKKATSSSQRY